MPAQSHRIALALGVLAFVLTGAITMPRPWRIARDTPAAAIPAGIAAAPRASVPARAAQAAAPQAPIASMPAGTVPAQPRGAIPDIVLAGIPGGPSLPVRANFYAVSGSQVRQGKIVTSSAEPLTVQAEISNATSGKHETRTISLSPHALTSIDEDWNLESGDQVVLRAQGFSELVRNVP